MLTVDTVHQDFQAALEAGKRLMAAFHFNSCVDMRQPYRIAPPCEGVYRVYGLDWVFHIVKVKHGWAHNRFYSQGGRSYGS